MSTLILVANPGSGSRKYALFDGTVLRAKLHFEYSGSAIACTLDANGQSTQITAPIATLDQAASAVVRLLHDQAVLHANEHIHAIGLRVVAPGGFFLANHVVDQAFVAMLRATQSRAPLHIAATLAELNQLRRQFPDTRIVGVSDSEFHRHKPDRAWNYGLPLPMADRHEIKRFGYHGLSAASVLRQIDPPSKVIICHLGSGASVTAALNGRGIDTTMGYSPLEGVIMATRSGSLDAGALATIKQAEQLDDHGLEEYLNHRSGLLGLGGSSDLRELLRREHAGDHRAGLAIATYIYSVQKAIGAMAAALNGVDMIIFTGTIGERSAVVRARITAQLGYLGCQIDDAVNQGDMALPKSINAPGTTPMLVVAAREEDEIARRTMIPSA